MTPEQEMWLLRATMPPPPPGVVWLQVWHRSRGRPFLRRVLSLFSLSEVRAAVNDLWPPAGPPPLP